jgi:hypothetical protein
MTGDDRIQRWTVTLLALAGLALAVYAGVNICAWLRQRPELIRPVPAAWAPPDVQQAARQIGGRPGAYVMWSGEASWLLLSPGSGEAGLALAGSRWTSDGHLLLYLRRSIQGQRVLILEGHRTLDWSQARLEADGTELRLPWLRL